MTIKEIINQYVVPNIPVIVATITTIASYVKCAGSAKKMLTNVTNKVNDIKQDKLLQELVEQNKTIIGENQCLVQENAKLRKQIARLIEVETKVKEDAQD